MSQEIFGIDFTDNFIGYFNGKVSLFFKMSSAIFSLLIAH